MNIKVAIMMLATIALSGCAVGNKIDYRSQVPTLSLKTTNSIAVAVHDQRPYIVSGDKRPNFVGLQRGGYGNPFNVTTDSGQSLADDIAEAIEKALRASDVSVQSVVIAPTETPNSATKRLLGLKTDRHLLVTFTEWKSDTMMNAALIYNVTAQVIDEAGAVLGENNISGRENLGGDFLNSPGHAAKAVPVAFSKNIERLISAPQIINALR